MKNYVISGLESGYIAPICDDVKFRIHDTMPCFFRKSTDGKQIVVVNLTNYATISKDRSSMVASTDNKKLFALFQSAVISSTYTSHYQMYATDQKLMKLGAEMYGQLFFKILDKQYAISQNPTKADQLRYITAKFFITYVMGRPFTDSVKGFCTNLARTQTPALLEQFDSYFNEEDFSGILTFITALGRVMEYPDLNETNFMVQYIRMFGEATVLGLEYLPFFLYHVSAVAIEARVANLEQLRAVWKDSALELYTVVYGIVKRCRSQYLEETKQFNEEQQLLEDIMLIEELFGYDPRYHLNEVEYMDGEWSDDEDDD